jgi:hypothetical protein
MADIMTVCPIVHRKLWSLPLRYGQRILPANHTPQAAVANPKKQGGYTRQHSASKRLGAFPMRSSLLFQCSKYYVSLLIGLCIYSALDVGPLLPLTAW